MPTLNLCQQLNLLITAKPMPTYTHMPKAKPMPLAKPITNS